LSTASHGYFKPLSFGIMGIRKRVYAMRGNMHISGTHYMGASLIIMVPQSRTPDRNNYATKPYMTRKLRDLVFKLNI